jgi:hypothetical protein
MVARTITARAEAQPEQVAHRRPRSAACVDDERGDADDGDE